MWWICDFPVGSASFPLKWIGICRLSCSWTPRFFYSLWWKTSRHLRAEPKPVQLCLAAAARAGHPNTAQVSDIHEANWVQMMYGALHNHTTVFSGTIYVKQIKDLLHILTTEKKKKCIVKNWSYDFNWPHLSIIQSSFITMITIKWRLNPYNLQQVGLYTRSGGFRVCTLNSIK